MVSGDLKEDIDNCKILIKSLLIPHKHGLSLGVLNRQYEESEGEPIPYQKLGFPTLTSMLNKFWDSVFITNDIPPLVQAIIDKDTLHIREMVNSQKNVSKKKKRRPIINSYINRNTISRQPLSWNQARPPRTYPTRVTPDRYNLRPRPTQVNPATRPVSSSYGFFVPSSNWMTPNPSIPVNTTNYMSQRQTQVSSLPVANPFLSANDRCNIEMMLAQNPRGIPFDFFPVMYRSRYGQELAFKDRGFQSLLSALSSIKDICTVSLNSTNTQYIVMPVERKTQVSKSIDESKKNKPNAENIPPVTPHCNGHGNGVTFVRNGNDVVDNVKVPKAEDLYKRTEEKVPKPKIETPREPEEVKESFEKTSIRNGDETLKSLNFDKLRRDCLIKLQRPVFTYTRGSLSKSSLRSVKFVRQHPERIDSSKSTTTEEPDSSKSTSISSSSPDCDNIDSQQTLNQQDEITDEISRLNLNETKNSEAFSDLESDVTVSEFGDENSDKEDEFKNEEEDPNVIREPIDSFPTRVLEVFKQILCEHPNGITAIKFLEAYKQKMNCDIDSTNWGFCSMMQVFFSLPSIFYIVPSEYLYPNSYTSEKILFAPGNVTEEIRRKCEMNYTNGDILNGEEEKIPWAVKVNVFKMLRSSDNNELSVRTFATDYYINFSQSIGDPSKWGLDSMESFFQILAEELPLELDRDYGDDSLIVRLSSDYMQKFLNLCLVKGERTTYVKFHPHDGNIIGKGDGIEVSSIERNHLSEGKFIPVRIDAALDPSKIFVTKSALKSQGGNNDTLNSLMNVINIFYEGLYSKLYHVPEEWIQEGFVCAVLRKDNYWNRGRILSVDKRKKQANVLFIDYGDNEEVSFKSLRLLRQCWCHILPAQAICINLSNIKPFQSDVWTQESCSMLISLSKPNYYLLLKASLRDEEERSVNGINWYNGFMVDPNNNYLSIEEMLVSNRLARFIRNPGIQEPVVLNEDYVVPHNISIFDRSPKSPVPTKSVSSGRGRRLLAAISPPTKLNTRPFY